jgi:phytol kinase
MLEVLTVALAYLLFFAIVEIVCKNRHIPKELSRKFTHIVAGTFAAFLPLFMTFHQIALLSFLFIPSMLFSKRKNIFSSIHEVDRQTYGEVYFAISIFLTALFFPHRELYMYGVLVMALSDACANIVGQKYGHKKYEFWGAKKSYAGSLAFFVMTFIIGSVILITLTSLSLSETLAISFWVGLVLTFIEGSLSKGLDNLILPVAAALLLNSFM